MNVGVRVLVIQKNTSAEKGYLVPLVVTRVYCCDVFPIYISVLGILVP